jgi:hypothetical protein
MPKTSLQLLNSLSMSTSADGIAMISCTALAISRKLKVFADYYFSSQSESLFSADAGSYRMTEESRYLLISDPITICIADCTDFIIRNSAADMPFGYIGSFTVNSGKADSTTQGYCWCKNTCMFLIIAVADSGSICFLIHSVLKQGLRT